MMSSPVTQVISMSRSEATPNKPFAEAVGSIERVLGPRDYCVYDLLPRYERWGFWSEEWRRRLIGGVNAIAVYFKRVHPQLSGGRVEWCDMNTAVFVAREGEEEVVFVVDFSSQYRPLTAEEVRVRVGRIRRALGRRGIWGDGRRKCITYNIISRKYTSGAIRSFHRRKERIGNGTAYYLLHEIECYDLRRLFRALEEGVRRVREFLWTRVVRLYRATGVSDLLESLVSLLMRFVPMRAYRVDRRGALKDLLLKRLADAG